MRGALKTAAAWGLHATGADRVVGALGASGRLPLILCYHRVVEDPGAHPHSAPAMLVGTGTLERQLDWIGRRFRFAPLDEVARDLEAGKPEEGRRRAVVTFDDGYADNYHHALPLLRRKGVPAAFFVVSGLTGTDRLLDHDELHARLRAVAGRLGEEDLADVLSRLGLGAAWRRHRSVEPAEVRLAGLNEELLRHLPRHRLQRLLHRLGERLGPVPALPAEVREELRPMSWRMLAELRDAGMTVGSHTHCHRVLTHEPPDQLAAELTGSKSLLEERLGIEVRHLSYPDGQFSPEVTDAARAAGYRFAYTTCGHRSAAHPLLTIPRRTFWERTTAGPGGGFSAAIASCQVAGVFDRLRPRRCDHRRRGRRRPGSGAAVAELVPFRAGRDAGGGEPERAGSHRRSTRGSGSAS